MKKFRSEALDHEGKKYAGVFEAENEKIARQMLEEQGFQITLLEVIPDVDGSVEEPVQKTKKALSPFVGDKSKKSAGKSVITASKKKPLRLLKFFVGGAIILCAFPLAIWLLSPEPPSSPPENKVAKYFEYEFQGKYDKQFELLSDSFKIKSESVENYIKENTEKKKQKYLKYSSQISKEESSEDKETDEKRDLDPEILEIKRINHHRRRAEMIALVRIYDFRERYLLKLIAQNSEWKIDSVKLMSYEVMVIESSAEVDDDQHDAEAEQKLVRLPRPKQSKSNSMNGVDEIKDQAFKMLEDAFRNGKINREEYEIRKKKIEQLQI